MTTQQAQESAAQLGLSVWVAQATVVTQENREEVVDLMCVGFWSAELPIAEAETWDEAMAETLRIVFGA